MTHRDDGPRDAHELADRVSRLGETPEDALEEIAGRNASLEERLPGEDRNRGDGRDGGDPPRGEVAPGQG